MARSPIVFECPVFYLMVSHKGTTAPSRTKGREPLCLCVVVAICGTISHTYFIHLLETLTFRLH
jgi:hypothetical protein